MITSEDFDFFLKNGYIKDLPPDTPMSVLIDVYGDHNWYVQHTETNGLIYGIIKVGFIEFHIYNEKLSGISYRPDISFPKKDFKGVTIPWIYKNRDIAIIEEHLKEKQIHYKKYTVQGPLRTYATAGGDWFGIEEGEHLFIDTEGGVTFLFEKNEEKKTIEAYQICKYYMRHISENNHTTA